MLLQRIRDHARDTPHHWAVFDAFGPITYAELQKRADHLALRLIEHNIQRGDVVAIYLPRQKQIIEAMLGTLLSGGSYSVIEADSRSNDLEYRLRAIAPSLIITDDEHAGDVAGMSTPTLRIGAAMLPEFDQHPVLVGSMPQAAPGDPAYLILTSGTTGTPKSVAISHGNIAHYAESLTIRFAINRPLQYAHVSTFAADLGNTGLFLSLWNGGTLHIVDDLTKRDPTALLRYLNDHAIDVLKITPSHWKAVFPVHIRVPFHLKTLILGGEVLTTQFAREIWRSGTTDLLVNHYGPTETTVGVCAYVISDDNQLESLFTDAVPIGTAIGETQLVVRTDDQSWRFNSGEGELYIGGPSVGLGYKGDPDATSAKFVTDNTLDGVFYRTGDLVRIDSEGVVHFRGRIDRQVKINGFRVELEHVESALGRLARVSAAAALVDSSSNGAQLTAFVSAPEATTAELQSEMSRTAPHYMVPTRWLILDELPRTANGKVDQAALRALLTSGTHDQDQHGPQAVDQGDLEKEIMSIWSKVLKRSSFGVDDSFLQAGADSLQVIQLVSELQAAGYAISANTFLRDPTIRGLSSVIRNRSPSLETERLKRTGGSRFSPAQLKFFTSDHAQPDYWNQALLFQCAHDVDTSKLARAVQAVMVAHPMLRTSYRRQRQGFGWTAHTLMTPPEDAFTESTHSGDPRTLAHYVLERSRALNRAISLCDGRVFKVHLLRPQGIAPQLFLTAHHLSVDAVSWRIILSDLQRGYDHADSALLSPPITFWDWVDDAGAVNSSESPITWPLGGRETSSVREATTRTAWLVFGEQMTRQLRDSRSALSLSAHILASFMRSYAKRVGKNRFWVDVETHGRHSRDERIDTSSVVGWFTSIVPLELAPQHLRVRELGEAILEQLSAPQPPSESGRLAGENAEICFNFLGRLPLPDGSLQLMPSHMHIAPARGPENTRSHALTLTGRIVSDHLAIDLSYSNREFTDAAVAAILRDTEDELHSAASRREPNAGSQTSFVGSMPGSYSGLLNFAPIGDRVESAVRIHAVYDHILITGATGFLGIHALRELLQQTRARITCLVRSESDQAAEGRLIGNRCSAPTLPRLP